MVTIKFSNKAVYTFIAVFILIVSIGISYALAPNPGHSVSEIEGLDLSTLCKTDGTDCPQLTCVTKEAVSPGTAISVGCDEGYAMTGCSCSGTISCRYVDSLCKASSKSFSYSGNVIASARCCKIA